MKIKDLLKESSSEHIMQSLADKDINSKVKGKEVWVDDADLTKAKSIVMKIDSSMKVKGGLNTK